MRKKFIAGNWKMYTTLNGAKELAAAVAKGVTDDKVTVAVCPPFPWLLPSWRRRSQRNTKSGWALRTAATMRTEGAYTGDVAPKMTSRSRLPLRHHRP